MLDAILQDLRYALRALRTSPAFTAVAILSLALGIGANTAIFSLIDSVILKTLPVSHPEQLVQVVMRQSPVFTNPIWEQVRDRQNAFSGIFAVGNTQFNLTSGGEARYARGYYSSGQFFDTLGVHALMGRTFAKADDQRGCQGTAVLSYGFWQREYGGRADVVGKDISLDSHPFEILGVLGPGFTGIDVGREQDIYVPICSDKIIHGENNSLDQRSWWWLRVIGRPAPGITPAQAEARLRTLAPQIFEATVPPRWRPDMQDNYRKRTFDVQLAANGLSALRRQYRQALSVLMGIVGVVLLIACANVANLLLARGAARQREIAIRMALGSRRSRLIRQLMTESMLLAVAGAALGAVFADWGSRLLVRLLSTGESKVFLDLTLDSRVLAFTIGVAALTGLLFGLAPAWRGTRVDPQSALKANARGVIEGSRFTLGKALVIAQVALSMILVAGAVLMLTTLFKLETLNPGFQRERVLLASVRVPNNYSPARRLAAFTEMLQRLRAVPGVLSASESSLTPISGTTWNELLHLDGYTARSEDDTVVYFNEVSDRFFETLRTDLIAGRDFNSYDTPQSPRVAIVNQTAANRYFRGQSPIGKRYRAEDGAKLGDPVEIIGVVRDAKYNTLREQILPTAYVAAGQNTEPGQNENFELRVAAGSPNALIPGVTSAIGEVSRDASLEFTTLALQVDESLTRERLLATLSGFFGALAMALAMIGLYGVMSFNVARRRNEIGIRMALGAEQSRVLVMVMREVAILIAIGLAAGLAATFSVTRFAESFLYGMKPNDPWAISSAAAALALVAILAGYVPAHKASHLDPMNAIREE